MRILNSDKILGDRFFKKKKTLIRYGLGQSLLVWFCVFKKYKNPI